MTAAGQATEHDERLDLLDALIYADTFDCAVTLNELWRFARVRVNRDALRVRLEDDPALTRVVVERDGFYALADRPELIAARPARLDRAHALEQRARRVARVLRHLPFVRGLALTGSTAAGDAGPTADVDMLLITEPGRVGTAFLLFGSLSRLTGRRLFCPNYYVSENGTAFQPGTIYLARELAQMTTLAGTCAALRARNPWLAGMFPNAGAPPEPPSARSRLQRLLERPLRGALGERVEAWGRHIASSRLRAHYRGLGQDVPSDVADRLRTGASLRFHGLHHDELALNGYAARRAEVATRLAEIDAQL